MNDQPVTTAAPAATPDLIVQAARLLAGVCDGAHLKDELGYNAVDSPFMKSVVQQERHSPRQLRAMWHILRKYKGQLADRGVAYEALVPPPLPPRADDGRFTAANLRLRLEWVDTKFGRRIALVFGYHPNLVEIARKLEKRWFDKERKAWLIPDDVDALDNALGLFEAFEPPLQIDVDPDLKDATDRARESRRKSYAMSRAASSDLDIPTKLPLLPFQRAGVEYIDAHGGRALVADEMGLGKTAQAIGWLNLRHEKALPALVVVPAIVRVNWVREFAKFSDLKAMVVCSKSSLKSFEELGIPAADRPLPGYDAVIVNYDLMSWPKLTEFHMRNGQTLTGYIEKQVKGKSYVIRTGSGSEIKLAHAGVARKAQKDAPLCDATINGVSVQDWSAFGFKTVVFDEAQALKEEKSQRTRVSLALAERIAHVIELTGTPLLNRPREIWTLTKAIEPAVFPSFFQFGKEFCGAFQDRFGWNFDGATNIDKLSRILRERVMIRRQKMEVLTELPERRRVTIPIMLNGALKEYQKEASTAIESLAELRREREEWKTRMNSMADEERRTYLAEHAEEKAKAQGITGHIISEITKLRRVAGLAKTEAAVDFILDSVEQAGAVIVFAHHHDVIDAYMGRLLEEEIRVVKVDGRDGAVARQTAVDAFQEGKAQVIVVSIAAGGVGMNLQTASNVIFVEFPWRPGDVDQAEARAWRMGQKNAVTTYFLIGIGTIEEPIARVIDAKREVVNAVVGESDRTIEDDGILDSILDEVIGA
jgi:SWI/SNF-related matrix-associated actin-dependent regulator 1 of chromatin subfamily A